MCFAQDRCVAADRLTEIIHYDASDNQLLRIAYTWNLDNTVYERTEHSPPDDTVTVRFTYDNRKRLIREKRYIPDMVPAVLYELAYTYDQLGNRVTKHDVQNDLLTCYAYDTDYDPATSTWDANLCFTPGTENGFYVTQNNRLLEYQVSGPEVAGERDLLRTVRYVYTNDGDAVHIVLKDEWTGQGAAPAAYDHYYALRLVYAGGGTLWLAVAENWENGWAPDPADASHTADYVREFRYDAPRQRYMVRDWDPVNYALPSTWLIDETSWTDYLGVQPYVDYDVTINGADPVASEAVRFIAALGVHGEKDVVAQGTPETYYHPDLTGSTTVTTDETGAQSARTAYTAFGEIVDPNGVVGYDPTLAPATRYQYDGAYGYESGLLVLDGANPDLPPITLQHVGARWYQPGIGRFVQRDPIGLDGGLNLYAYCRGNPGNLIDPTGEGFWDGNNGFHDWVARNFWLRFHSPEHIQSPAATAEAIGLSVAGGVAVYAGAKFLAVQCIRAAGYNVRFGVHGPHHPFPGLGRLPHAQWNWWRPGVKGSGGAVRIPLPPGSQGLGFPLF